MSGACLLYIDSSKISLRVVLLHNGNMFPFVPLAHASYMKEPYELQKFKYADNKWNICSNLKVVTFTLKAAELYQIFLILWEAQMK